VSAPGQASAGQAARDALKVYLTATITAGRDHSGECAQCLNSVADVMDLADAYAQAALAAREPDAADGDLRTALESLAAFWVSEYVTADGWPDVCAKQLLDVLGGAREPQPAPGDDEMARALAIVAAERNQYRMALDKIARVGEASITETAQLLARLARRALDNHPQPEQPAPGLRAAEGLQSPPDVPNLDAIAAQVAGLAGTEH